MEPKISDQEALNMIEAYSRINNGGGLSDVEDYFYYTDCEKLCYTVRKGEGDGSTCNCGYLSAIESAEALGWVEDDEVTEKGWKALSDSQKDEELPSAPTLEGALAILAWRRSQ